MAYARLVDNFSSGIGSEILDCIATSRSMMMAVAFVRFSGVELVEDNLLELLERGGRAEMILGLDFSLTEPRALRRILEIKNEYPAFKAFAFSNPYSPGRELAFHPKLYMFERTDNEWTVLIGSSNLSYGGLVNNVEVGVTVGGVSTDPIIVAAFDFYARVRGRESVFVPNDDYLDAYEEIHSAVENRKEELESQRLQDAIAELQQLEVSLPGTVPTQKELIVLAIKSLRADPESWVHWSEIAQFVEARARSIGIEYDWGTLDNSVRGRLNEHTDGKYGDDLFERKGGVSGRFGMYRLTTKGERLVDRTVLE
jgi:HKD family nuclease